MTYTQQQLDEAKRRLQQMKMTSDKSPSSVAVKKTKEELTRPQPGIFTRILEAPGKAVEAGAEKIIRPIAKEIARPFLRTAATGVSALRGAWNLATGNIEKEQIAQAKEDQRGGVDLGPLGVQRPVQMKEGGGTQDTAHALADIAGTGSQIAATVLAPGISKFGAGIGAPAAAANLVAGGVGGLLHGAGSALEKSATEDKGALETVGDVATGGATEGALGAAAGFGFGKLEDWWNAPAPKTAKTTKPVPPKSGPPKGSPSPVEQARAGIESMREPLPSDAVKKEVLEKAKTLDDVLESDLPASSNAPGASGMDSKAFKVPRRPASKSAQELIDSGMNPNRLREMNDMGADDLRALQKAVENGQRVTRMPGDKSKIRLAEGLADNVEQNVDAMERVTRPYATAISDAVRKADQSLFDENAFGAKVAEALPDRTIKMTASDKKFVESLIDEFDQIKTLEDVHEFRQKIAGMTDQYAAPLKAAGVKETEGEKVAGAMRQKMGEYLDEVLADSPVTVNGEATTYGELRRRIRPLLDAQDEFWKAVGGKWKGYDSDARNRRLGEIAGRLATNASANTDAAFANLKNALKAEGVDVGGDLAKQASYVKFVEDLFNAGPDRALQQNVTQGVVNAGDLIGAAKNPVGAGANYGINKLLNIVGITGERAREKATEKVRRAFADYVQALLRSKGG